MVQTILLDLLTDRDVARRRSRPRGACTRCGSGRSRTRCARAGVELAAGDGINLWLPVRDERDAIVQLAAAGIRVAPGAPFQLGDSRRRAHVRVTVGRRARRGRRRRRGGRWRPPRAAPHRLTREDHGPRGRSRRCALPARDARGPARDRPEHELTRDRRTPATTLGSPACASRPTSTRSCTALAGVNDTERGWGRAGETERVSAELAAWGVGWPWFTLGDLDLGAHLARTAWLREGAAADARSVDAAAPRAGRSACGCIPATDDEVDTHVIVADADDRRRARAALPGVVDPVPRGAARDRVPSSRNVEDARARARACSRRSPAPTSSCSRPRTRSSRSARSSASRASRDAVRETPAPVVGVSPIIGGAVVRGMADACLAAIGVETAAEAVATALRRSRPAAACSTRWLVGDEDADVVAGLRADGIAAEAVPLWMRDPATSAAVAEAALAVGTLAGRGAAKRRHETSRT